MVSPDGVQQRRVVGPGTAPRLSRQRKILNNGVHRFCGGARVHHVDELRSKAGLSLDVDRRVLRAVIFSEEGPLRIKFNQSRGAVDRFPGT
jgi:hypothetical protein